MQMRALVGDGAYSCGTETTMQRVAVEMDAKDVGSLGVVSEGGLVGIVTERDVLRAVAADVDMESEPVTSWMTPQPDSVSPDVETDEAARWMLATGYRHLPVMEGNTLLGIASIKDVLWAVTPVND